MKVFTLFLLSFFLISSTAHAQELPEIVIAEYGEFLLYSPLYIAAESQLFEEQGLKVKIIPAGGDEKVFAALIAGQAQFGVGDPTFVAISGEKGKPGRIIYSLLQSIPAAGVAKSPEIKPILHPSELSGFSVATYPAPSTSYSMQKRIFQIGGIKPNIVPITYGGLLPALFSGRVDIALEYEPNVSLALEQGAHLVYSVTPYFPEFALTGLSVLPEYLEKNSLIAQKIVNALRKATDVLFRDLERAVMILKRRFPEYSEAVIRSALQNSMQAKAFSETGIVSRKGWNEAVLMRKELGDLKAEASYDDYVISRYAEESLKVK